MRDSDLEKSFIIYLDIDKKIRRDRLLSRKDESDSVERRIQSDDLDFSAFVKFNLKITNPFFDSKEIYELINYGSINSEPL